MHTHRLLTGENFFVSKFIYRGQQTGRVALGTSFPSKILRLRLNEFADDAVICQKGAFLCGSDTVNIEMVRSFALRRSCIAQALGRDTHERTGALC